jgi:hypothetical protein
MASPFDITVATNTIVLDNNREGVATFTVKNSTRRRIRGLLRVITQPPESPAGKWVTIVPPEGATGEANARDFVIDSTQQIQVKVAAPMDAAPGSYALRLIVADEVSPEENFTTSPDVVFTVRELPKPEPRRLPGWLIPAAILALLAVVGMIAIALVSSNNQRIAGETATQLSIEQARLTADAGTAVAFANLTATQAALNQAQEQANATATVISATQQALNVYLGTWVPTGDTGGMLTRLAISDAGSNQVNISYTANCPPEGNICFTSPSTYTINNVPFNPSQLAASISATQLLIQPSNNSQLFITMRVGSTTLTQTLRRQRRFEDIDVGIEIIVTSSVFSQAAVRQLQQFALTPNSP